MATWRRSRGERGAAETRRRRVGWDLPVSRSLVCDLCWRLASTAWHGSWLFRVLPAVLVLDRRRGWTHGRRCLYEPTPAARL